MKYSDALVIATVAHDGMVDRGGAPYIGHPARVAAAVEGNSDKVVALLHDVIEDCGLSVDAPMFEELSMAERDALDAISKRDGEDYADYLRRVAANPIARRVKIADIEDNMDLSRIPEPSPKDFERVEKYKVAKMFLESVDLY